MRTTSGRYSITQAWSTYITMRNAMPQSLETKRGHFNTHYTTMIHCCHQETSPIPPNFPENPDSLYWYECIQKKSKKTAGHMKCCNAKKDEKR